MSPDAYRLTAVERCLQIALMQLGIRHHFEKLAMTLIAMLYALLLRELAKRLFIFLDRKLLHADFYW